MSIPEKLITAIENVHKVYESGKNSMVDESKLLPTTVYGNYISVDDVSEVPHKVTCKISGVENPENVKVTRTGKNLCPEEVESGYYWDSSGTPSGANASYIRVKPFAVSPSTTYTISSNLFISSVWLYNAEGSIKRVGIAVGLHKITLTAPKNCTEFRISLHNTSGAADTVAFEYAQCEVGNTATEYEPYIQEQTLTPNADGTVDGMMSVSPYMNVFSDTEGANIATTYNKSWGMQEERERFYNDFQQGKINVSISFEWLILSNESILSIINALSDTALEQTVTFKKSANEAAFTDDEWTALVATKPNWTFALL